MGRKATALLPKHARIVSEVGENLRLARLRRRLSAQQVADRAGISRSTRLAADDVLGRKLEDARLTETRQRAPKRRKEEP